MQEQLAIQTLLRKRLTEKQLKNPAYSLRSFAKQIGMHSGALSSLLAGKRRLSRKAAERIADELMLDPQERAELLSLFPAKRPYRKAPIPAQSPRTGMQYLQITADQFRIIAGWEHFAILSLLKMKKPPHHPARIAERLGVSEEAARQAVARLIRAGLVKREKFGTLSRTESPIRTTDDIADLSIRKSHQESLLLAERSLLRDPVEMRDLSSITLAIDPSTLPRAKELIRKFQDDLAELVESGERTEVYRFCTQLFPLTQLTKELRK